MNSPIPLVWDQVAEEDVAAVIECLRGGWLTMGPRTAELEQELARWLSVPHVVALATGTAALRLAFYTMDLRDDDQVIVPAISRPAVAQAVRGAGGQAVVADIRDTDDSTVDPAEVKRRLTRQTRAVVVSHPWGYPADVVRLRELCHAHGVAVVEDATEAFGAVTLDGTRRLGSVGDIGCLSFGSGRQLAVGQGGAFVTHDEEVAARVRLLRSHALSSTTWDRHRGHADTYDVVEIGFNFRIDEPRAALALSRLPRLQAEVLARRAAERRYRERLPPLRGIRPCFDQGRGERAAPLAFPLLANDAAARAALSAGLAARGVQSTGRRVVRSRAASGATPLRAAELAARAVVLPLHAWQRAAEVDRILDALGSALSEQR